MKKAAASVLRISVLRILETVVVIVALAGVYILYNHSLQLEKALEIKKEVEEMKLKNAILKIALADIVKDIEYANSRDEFFLREKLKNAANDILPAARELRRAEAKIRFLEEFQKKMMDEYQKDAYQNFFLPQVANERLEPLCAEIKEKLAAIEEKILRLGAEVGKIKNKMSGREDI